MGSRASSFSTDARAGRGSAAVAVMSGVAWLRDTKYIRIAAHDLAAIEVLAATAPKETA